MGTKKPYASRKGGRQPGDDGFSQDMVRMARRLSEFGLTRDQIADAMDVSDSTLYRYTVKYPEFADAFRVGGQRANDRVVRSLFEQAVGYRRVEERLLVVSQGRGAGSEVERHEVTVHVEPSLGACVFWLKNRASGEWKDKQQVDAEVRTGEETNAAFAEFRRAVELLAAEKSRLAVRSGRVGQPGQA